MTYWFSRNPPDVGDRLEASCAEWNTHACACAIARGIRWRKTKHVYVYRYEEDDLHGRMEQEIVRYAPRSDELTAMQCMRDGLIPALPLDSQPSRSDILKMIRNGRIGTRAAAAVLQCSEAWLQRGMPDENRYQQVNLYAAERLRRMLRENCLWERIVSEVKPGDFSRHASQIKASPRLDLLRLTVQLKGEVCQPPAQKSCSTTSNGDWESVTFTAE